MGEGGTTMLHPRWKKALRVAFYVALAYVLLFLFVEVIGTITFLRSVAGG